jgi:hypothetical protein
MPTLSDSRRTRRRHRLPQIPLVRIDMKLREIDKTGWPVDGRAGPDGMADYGWVRSAPMLTLAALILIDIAFILGVVIGILMLLATWAALHG